MQFLSDESSLIWATPKQVYFHLQRQTDGSSLSEVGACCNDYRAGPYKTTQSTNFPILPVLSQDDIKDLWFKLLAEIVDNAVPALVTIRTSARYNCVPAHSLRSTEHIAL